MAKARFDIPTQLPVAVSRPIYAGVGATDRVVAVVRGAVADVQKRAQSVQQDVQKTVTGLDYQPQALREQAAHAVTARVETLGKDAQARRIALQSEARHLPARLQKLVDEQVANAGSTYDELVRRGETLVGRIRRQPATKQAAASASTTAVKAKTTRTQATKTAKKTTTAAKRTARKSPAKSSAKATATSAKKTAGSAARATTAAGSKVGDSHQ
jgi:heparin binding hemagglutinin HbhA